MRGEGKVEFGPLGREVGLELVATSTNAARSRDHPGAGRLPSAAPSARHRRRSAAAAQGATSPCRRESTRPTLRRAGRIVPGAPRAAPAVPRAVRRRGAAGLPGHARRARVERVAGGTYRRTLRLERGTGSVELTPSGAAVHCRLRLDDLGDLTAAVARCRRLLDLDADPGAVAEHLGRRPAAGRLGARPARACACRAAWTASSTRCGPSSASRCRWPVRERCSVAWRRPRRARRRRVAAVPECRPCLRNRSGAVPVPARARRGAARARPAGARRPARSRRGRRPGGHPRHAARHPRHRPVDGVYVAMRALGDPDAWLPGDVGVRNALAQLGCSAERNASPRAGARGAPTPWSRSGQRSSEPGSNRPPSRT